MIRDGAIYDSAVGEQSQTAIVLSVIGPGTSAALDSLNTWNPPVVWHGREVLP
jgi:hypothetical protein